MFNRLTKLVEMLGVNSVPVVGVVAGEWSSATALTVYWAENLIASLLIGARLWLHRRWTAGAEPGTPGGEPPPVAQPPSAFLSAALPFTLAHGMMLAAVFFIVTKMGPDLAHVRQAITALLVFQGLAFGADLWSLGHWPAHRVNERADHLLGRVVLVHLSIIAGMFLFAWLERPGAFFGFFIGCKVLSDLTQFLPRAATAPGSAPPRWLSAIMRRVPKQNGETFEQHWARTHGRADAGPPPPPAPRPRTEQRRR